MEIVHTSLELLVSIPTSAGAETYRGGADFSAEKGQAPSKGKRNIDGDAQELTNLLELHAGVVTGEH